MTRRFAYLDNLRVLLVVGVIAVHAAITYGLDGSWYLESYEQMAGVVVAAVTVVLGVGWLFGLGLFFLIAGRLSGPSLERKGAVRFARERLVRLGIPLLGYTLLVSPFLEYIDYRFNAHGEEALWPFVGRQVWHLAPGPTWLLEALLVFSLAYALLRRLSRQAEVSAWGPLRTAEVAAVAVALALISFVVRFAFPLGSEQFHLQLSVFPQYAMMFALGAAAGRRGWLETFMPRLARRCAATGALAALALPGLMIAGGFFGDGGEHRFEGGWHWQAAALALDEAVLATCVSLWAVQHFRRRRNTLGPLARRMAPAAYGAFIIHPPVLVGLALAAQHTPLPAELKFIAVLAAAVAASFGLAALGSRIRHIGAIIGSPSTAPSPAKAWPWMGEPREHGRIIAAVSQSQSEASVSDRATFSRARIRAPQRAV
jgi:glucans biosynthesis protein C